MAYRDLGTTTRKRQGRADAQRSSAGLRGRRRELDRDGAVDRLEDGHGEVGQRGAADGVGERAPAGHARVGRVHPQLVCCVAKAGGSRSSVLLDGLKLSDAEMNLHLLAVPFADLEDGRAGRHRSRNVLGGCRAGRHGDRGRGNFVFALVVDHGIGSGFHGGRGEAAVGGRVGPVLRLIVVPGESVILGN